MMAGYFQSVAATERGRIYTSRLLLSSLHRKRLTITDVRARLRAFPGLSIVAEPETK